ncbi:MAG TPA: VTT domain-containing protein [Candidatus Baltobacteraceae bacterium]|nr:VTT domain-containing protein [Candidatus Baltobacteraceae bacterium]
MPQAEARPGRLARRIAGIAMLACSFVLAALVIRYQPWIEHVIRIIRPVVAVPIATVIFALVASAPFSVTDALAIMNGAIFGPFWGSIVNAAGIVAAGFIGYWINRHATHLLDLEKALERLPAWVKRFRIGSPMFLIAVRIIPGFGGTVATATAATFKVPVWVHVMTMSAVAIPVCTILAIFGDGAVAAIHGYEHRAHMYILHHRPHWHFRFRHRLPSPSPRGPGM